VTEQQPITLVEFLKVRIDEAALPISQKETGPTEHECFRNETWQYWASGDRVRIVSHCGCSTPEDLGARRALRDIEAKRRVLARHGEGERTNDYVYCQGCPGDSDGFPQVPLDECPEFQDLAYIWNDHKDWDAKWCPHVEGRHHEAAVTELPPARGAYTNACNRCGAGDGWHYRKDRGA
jgi:hypothetical protein